MSKRAGFNFSIIVPVHNRPEEVDDLLKSLCVQIYTSFEVVIVEDGSTLSCEDVVNKYKKRLSISYYTKENSGPGLTRNYGYEKAKGNYFIFLDSDCVLPPHYLQIVQDELSWNYADIFGGPDKAHARFSPFVKAVNYAMTSFFTTGGIRNSEKKGNYYPRSFNMGYSKRVHDKTGGFSTMLQSEDIDLSIRIKEAGFAPRFLKKAYVYHKRRTNLFLFFKQIFAFGRARVLLGKRYPESKSLIYFLPSIYLLVLILIILLCLNGFPWLLLLPLFHFLLILIDSSIKNRSLLIGFLSIFTSLVQFSAYGAGFIYGLLADSKRIKKKHILPNTRLKKDIKR